MSLVSDYVWLLWVVPVSLALALGLGWWLRGMEQRRWHLSSQASPQAYFRGLNHLLNEQHDQAIDAFIEAVQQDPDTSELHFALGNLFRRRGDYDRAVRVHEHLLRRADVKASERQRAQHGLAMDFLKAGLLDRAEDALLQLVETPYASDARLALLGIYERGRDWTQALVMAQQLDGGEHGSFKARMAHYHCELAQEAQRREPSATESDALHAALHLDPNHVRSHLELAQRQHNQGQSAAALQTLQRCVERQPQSLPLIAPILVHWVDQDAQLKPAAMALLAKQAPRQTSVDITMARAHFAPEACTQLFQDHLAAEPSLIIAAESLRQVSSALPAHVLETVARSVSPMQRYRCAACGFEAHTYFWQCPGCQTWDSFPTRRVEEL
jgi:lipopolysaccharide assembly protein B